ncbi:BTAD domain-containing putative transcriptional regulator [Frankia sp. QA3]|uniref:BTAD domain-containing putative transcriptional regulator n=1 Tax=Frankia sp. QA3 TaxID=710111 RepID=UPI0002D8C5E5|nr:BTAD domain-containing putative transcriptional regulator [Frankia sp. QA3]
MWNLRGSLASAYRPGSEVSLETRSPGYVLNIDPGEIDVFQFHDLAARGHQALADHAPRQALELLRDAVALWRGPVLADLVEAGIVWPELAPIESARLVAMEDRFDAELQCGGQYTVLGDLESLVEAEPFRERLVAQLMLALYRCGRQADALSVYARFRAALVEQLGLDPGRELQVLQQSILAQSANLELPGQPSGPPVRRESALLEAGRARAAPATAAESLPRWPTGESVAADPIALRQASALMVQVKIRPTLGADDGSADDLLADVEWIVRSEVERVGGTMAASIGAIHLALFTADSRRDVHAEHAVLVAMAIRNRVEADPRGHHIVLQAAVSTGRTIARPPDEQDLYPAYSSAAPPVNSALVVECQVLVSHGEGGEIFVCDRTRLAASGVIAFERTRVPHVGWRVAGLRGAVLHAAGEREFEFELVVLQSLLSRVIHRRRPHLVSVLGLPRNGKPCFMATFESRVRSQTGHGLKPLQVLRTRAFAGVRGLRTEILLACCGVQPADPPGLVREKLARTVREVMDASEHRMERAVAGLTQLLVEQSDDSQCTQDRGAATVREWTEVVTRIVHDQPMVVFIDELHLADDNLLNFVEGLPGALDTVPLMVVVTAGRPELLQRRPDWGGGEPHSTTLTLDVEPTAGCLQLSHR